MTTCVLYLDMNGVPVANSWLTTNKQRKALTDAYGIARFDPDLPADVVFYPVGYGTATVFPCAEPPPPPTPAPIGSMGYCQVESYQSAFGTLFRYGRGEGEELGSGYTSYQSAEYSASLNTECKIALPAPVLPVTQADLDAVVAASKAQTEHAGAMLLNIISNTATTIFDAASQYADDLFASVNAKLSEMRTDIETNLISPLLTSVGALWDDIGALWASLEEVVDAAEQEVNARIKAISDLEAGMKAWVEAGIIDILISALDREVAKEVKK